MTRANEAATGGGGGADGDFDDSSDIEVEEVE